MQISEAGTEIGSRKPEVVILFSSISRAQNCQCPQKYRLSACQIMGPFSFKFIFTGSGWFKNDQYLRWEICKTCWKLKFYLIPSWEMDENFIDNWDSSNAILILDLILMTDTPPHFLSHFDPRKLNRSYWERNAFFIISKDANSDINWHRPPNWVRWELKIIVQAPVVQTLDNTIYRINHYPVDKC